MWRSPNQHAPRHSQHEDVVLLLCCHAVVMSTAIAPMTCGPLDPLLLHSQRDIQCLVDYNLVPSNCRSPAVMAAARCAGRPSSMPARCSSACLVTSYVTISVALMTLFRTRLAVKPCQGRKHRMRHRHKLRASTKNMLVVACPQIGNQMTRSTVRQLSRGVQYAAG